MKAPRWTTTVVVMGLVGLFATSCSGDAKVARGAELRVVTTVAPIADLASRVGGTRTSVSSLVPRGEAGHTYAPRPSDAKTLVGADAFIDNGFGLNPSISAFAEQYLPTEAKRLVLGDALPPGELISAEATCHFGHCHPSTVNPHLWPDPMYAAQYVRSIGAFLSQLDPPGKATYEANADVLSAQIVALHRATEQAVATIPQANRKLAVYHDAWSYFARRYSLTMVGVIQPVNFGEPTAAEVADIIRVLNAEHVAAFFGSEVFPSDVLETIGREAGVRYVPDLSDDRLPGKAGEPLNSYVGLMATNVRLIVSNLGGDARAIDSVTPR